MRIRFRVWLVLSMLLAACDCGDGNQLTAKQGQAKVDPSLLDFGNVTVGANAVRAVSVKNIGDYPLRIENTRISQPEAFTIAQRLPDSIEAGLESSIAIEFAPSNEGPWEGTLTIETDDADGSHDVMLRGNGVAAPIPPPACQLTVNPAAVQYPPVQVGSSAEQTVTISNSSEGDCTIARLEPSGDGASDFALTSANPGTLAPGASSMIGVRFTRSMTADRASFLDIESNDSTTALRRIPLLVGAQRPGLCVMPVAIFFGATSGSATRDIIATACGDHDVDITGLDFTTANAEISLASQPTFTIPQGESRTITVQYAPVDQINDLAILTVRSNDALVPTVDVEITGSPDIVPEDVGRFLYYWQVDGTSASNIIRVPLQGGGAAVPYWGQSTGQSGCPGCHQVSRDGRYVAVVEFDFLQTLYVVDTMTDTKISLPLQLLLGSSFSWRPDVGGSPAYQYVVGVNGDLRLGSIGDGYLGDLAGASDPNLFEAMPAWGPDGEIVFVRGEPDLMFPGFGFEGATDLLTVPEAGGTAAPLAGASGNTYGNYYPSFSPNGRWVSFTQSRAGVSTYAADDAQVRLVAADGSGTVLELPLINGNDGATSFPTWSRDGSYLSLSSNRSGGVGDWDIYIAPIDQATGMELGAPTNLNSANTAGFEHAAQWSP